eukprot:CAMPEP_0204245160 /NCGR_PEP_ID=MMETSP0361-20130328/97458_1 /ASSEMBLY_ACC=CAM_ASM_000343 /TAXON_ID=268821 /ORGANISM="Scrippsiella Hangoei, Strain SHTV-5" /LENGTH=97 /DNA_ID=CAMNT_0051218327 /DNA_START=162 /DNA_END=450 /DNA_ORIENTATION=+
MPDQLCVETVGHSMADDLTCDSKTKHMMAGSTKHRLPTQAIQPGLRQEAAGVDTFVAELLLDAHELIVLRIAIRAARRSRLDLTRAQADGQVRDGRV